MNVKPPSTWSNRRPNDLPGLARLVLQPLDQLRERHAGRRLDDEVRLAGDGPQPRLAAPVPVRPREARQRRPVQEELAEHAALHHRHAARAHALVVVLVEAGKLGVAELRARRVRHDIQERRQDRLAHHLRERLRIVGGLLPRSLDSVAEDLVEEDAGRAAREDRRPGVRVDHRRGAEPGERDGQRANVLDELRFRREARDSDRAK